jgi:hypothetical protein
MHPGKFVRYTLGLSLFLMIAFAAQAGFCGYTADCSQAPTWQTGHWTVKDCLNFEAANDDASRPATPAKVSASLLAIVPPRQYAGTWPVDPINKTRLNGGKISWEGVPGNSRIRVAAFMDTPTYKAWYYPCMFGGKTPDKVQHPEGGEAVSVLGKGLWITVVPELRNYFWTRPCGACPPGKERVVQLIGLNPRNSYDVIVEMWVNMEDVYRPAPDPGTTAHMADVAAQLDQTITVWGQVCKIWAFPDPWLFFSTDQSYQMWFAYNAATTYYNPTTPKNTAPWTRLGYTYDWGNPKNHVGASEFMIRLHPNLVQQGISAVYATYIRAIKDYDKSWNEYFHCAWRGDRISSDNVPDADVNKAAQNE